MFNARLPRPNLVTKADFDAKISSLNRKITANKSNHLLVENEFKKLKKFYSSYFRSKSHFVDNDDTENYLLFQAINRYFKVIANTNYLSSWKSKRLSDESYNPPAINTSDNSLSPLIHYLVDKIRLKFNDGCLKQFKLQYIHAKTINIYIVYELTASSSNDDDPEVRKSSFGAVRLIKNADIDKYGYSGLGIGFDRKGSFSFYGDGFGINAIIFGVDMSSSVHVDNKKKDILILGKGPTQGLEHIY